MRLKISLIFGVLIGQLGSLFVPVIAQATSSNVIISGLQTASLNSTSEEFVELLNPTAASLSISGWQLQYRSATATNGTDCTKGWNTKATVTIGTLAPGERYLLSSTGYLSGDINFAAGFASGAGTIRIIDGAKEQIDALAWGSASCGTGTAAPAPAAGESLVRHDGTAGAHSDNSLDFTALPYPLATVTPAPSLTPEPSVAPTPIVTVEPEPSPSVDPTPSPAEGVSSLRLNELLIDPISPQTDAQDEFVELFNAGTEPVDVENFVIKAGSSQYKLPAGTIAPGEYLNVTSAGTSISLSNSGGVANLIDPAGNIVDTAGTWDGAVPGSSWAFYEDVWTWTTTPTPGAANIMDTGGLGELGEYLSIELSELLPDPAAPLTDADDEFIELYNPNDQAVELTGYVLKAGHDLTAKYVINNLSIPAAGYVAIKSADSKLALSNSGSSVALYAPNGVQLGQTITYPKAASGNAWARLNGDWDWTSEPTPANDNVIAPVAIAAAAAAKTPKAKASPKVAAPKVKAAAKTKAATKVKAAKTAKAKTTKPLLAGTTSSGGRWLLYILAGLTLGYIIYEFRHDIRNYYYKLRGYPIGRPALVPVPAGRGSDRADQRPGRR